MGDDLNAVHTRRGEHDPEPIAIVGIGCRFPGGVDSPARFWELLCAGTDAIGAMPPGRFDIDRYYSDTPGMPGKVATREGGFLPAIDQFDAAFFGIAPREAARIDPQQRLLLETAWEALEDAGLPREQIAGSQTGVFVGLWTGDYEARLVAQPDEIDLYAMTGSGRYSAAGRLSYAFDLRGPSFTIDTACSSSLVATHLACRSLREGESDVALAGGANVILEPSVSIGYSRSRMLSPDGRCKFGDARANGYVRSEGCGLLVLKRLADAQANGDPIYAVIRGSAVNNDGQSSGFLMQPAVAGQIAMLRDAYARAGVDPAAVQYVEAHGTGTAVGDPVELEALGAVLGTGRAADRPFSVGSVKTNVGHTESASGVAGLIKTALALKYRTLPASLHFETPNPQIPWERLPLRIQQTLEPWPGDDGPRFAGVSSFGITGTNAHVILQEAPASPARAAATPHAAMLLPLSAHSAPALADAARALRSFIAGSTPPLVDLCYTAGARRSHLPERLALVVGDRDAALDGLDAFLQERPYPGIQTGRADGDAPRVVFVFPGQGGQWLGMGRRLAATEPVFAAALARCAAAIEAETGWSLLDVFQEAPDRSRLGEIDVAQPAIFAIQVALGTLLAEWGIRPAAVVGHSMGEVAAAHVAGALSLADAAAVICRRSRLLRRVRGRGAMAATDLTLEEATALLTPYGERVAVAASNGPTTTVLSGDPAALDELLAHLQGQGRFARLVQVEVASHSAQVDPLLDDLQAALAAITPAATSSALISTVTGAPIAGTALGSDYWARNLRQPVLFWPVIAPMAAETPTIFLELSPHPVLLGALESALQAIGQGSRAFGTLRREQDESATLRETVGALWTAGVVVDWARLNPEGNVLQLPGYPWQRESFWFDADHQQSDAQHLAHRADTAAETPLGTPLPELAHLPGSRFWQGRIAPPHDASDGDTLNDVPLVPGIAAALLAWRALGGASNARVRDLAIENHPLLTAPIETQTILSAQPDGTTLQLFTRPGPQASWMPWATMRRDADTPAPEPVDLTALRAAMTTTGPAESGSREVWLRPGEALARLALPETDDAGCSLIVSQAIRRLVAPNGGEALLLAAIASASCYGDCRRAQWLHLRYQGEADTSYDLRLLTADGAIIAELRGLRLRAPDDALLRRTAMTQLDHWTYTIDWRAAPPADGAAVRADEHWLIVADAGDIGTRLATSLEETGARVHLLRLGAADPACLQAEFATLLGGDRPACARIVDLRALDRDDADLLTATARRSLAALTLAQAVARTHWRSAPRLWLITRSAQAAAGAPRDVAAAALWGLGHVIAAEHPEFWGGLIDLDAVPSTDEITLLRHSLIGHGAETEVAIRGIQALVPRLARTSLASGTPLALRPDATYLISGGAGGLGLAVARWMVESGARHLALLGRSPLGAAAAQAVADLEVAGARVAYLRGDIARQKDVAAIFATIARDMPPLRGIVHAAVVLADAALAGQTAEGIATVMAPKVAGAWHLAQASRALPLDFLAFFSSASTLLGTPGQANYAAANATLDAYAHQLRADGVPAISIAWGSWSDIGLATTAERSDNLGRLGLRPIAPVAGLTVLGHALGAKHPYLAAFDIVWPTYLANGSPATRFADFAAAIDAQATLTSPATDTTLRDRLTAAAPDERRTLILEEVRALAAAVLRFKDPRRIAPGQGFFQMGMDSLTAVELKNRVQQRLDLVLPATLVFDYPTPLALSGRLLAELFPPAIPTVHAPLDEDAPTPATPLARDVLRDLLEAELAAISEELD